MTLWRISRHADLSGIGGVYAGGRWHTRGQRVVYLADHPASCLLEMLVQAGRVEDLPPSYQWLRVDGPDDVVADVGNLPSVWREDVAATRARGDAWLASKESALLRVPSVLAPEASNYLLNPTHPDTPRFAIERSVDFPLDERFQRFPRESRPYRPRAATPSAATQRRGQARAVPTA
ncbi:MAG: RES family NAD+ phosphorylase [Acidobacteria bacterium]|nr:RES family NAD+ phosphorylase [Acidobacteriota bacterium]